MRRKSEKTKAKEGYGTGTGANYIPQIATREINSTGTTCNLRDWTTGRTVELMSQIEMKIWYLLRWDNRVADIREQFPLNLEITKKIAEDTGIFHPRSDGEYVHMTTDFLVDLIDGTQIAIYVKPNKNDWKKSYRSIEKAYIEKYYWEEIMNIPFIMVSSDDINEILFENIELVCLYFNYDDTHDQISKLKHLIATKKIVVDMDSELLDFRKLLKIYGDKVCKI